MQFINLKRLIGIWSIFRQQHILDDFFLHFRQTLNFGLDRTWQMSESYTTSRGTMGNIG